MSTLILFGLLLAAAAYIAAPIIRKRPDGVMLANPNHAIHDLESQKENLLAAIQELEFDYRSGKLSSEDFEHLNADYRKKAISVIQKIKRLDQKAADDIELQIKKYRELHSQ
ncbi:MAG: hypothetical protein GWP06_01940 [Actinobacteria bacterium]|nr:hypothetical protein [Actinomycetota bacterium]